MSKSLPKFINNLLVSLIVLFVFLLPFFFLPVSTEYYEFNKQALLTALLVIGYLLLALRMVVERRVIFVKTKLDLPILLLLAVCTASTIFSASPLTSFFGQHGVFHGGLLSLILYIGLFYLITQIYTDKNTDKRRFFLISHFSFLISSFLLSALAILQYFEIYLFPWDFARWRFWMPIGKTKTFLVYLFAALPLIFARLVKVKGLRSEILSEVEGKVLPCLVLILTLAALFLVSGSGGPLRNFLPEKYREFPEEVSLDWQTSWPVVKSVLRNRPLFGSGPGTFSSDFARFKPQSFNQDRFWNIRFSHPANEWFELAACLGLSGLIVYFYFWVRVFKLGSTQIKQIGTDGHRLTLPLLASLLALLISTFFCPTTTVTAILFWLLLALFVTEAGLTEKVLIKAEVETHPSREKNLTKEIPLALVFFVLSSLFLVLCGHLFFFRYYKAEVFYQRAVVEFDQDREKAFDLALSAAQLNPLNDIYQAGLSTASLGVGSQLSRQDTPNLNLIRKFTDQAMAAGERAVQLGPENVRNWENLAAVYQGLLKVVPDAERRVMEILNQAIKLDPVNPVLRNHLANFFLERGENEKAIEQFLLAIDLKPDYAQNHYDLARAYKAFGNLDKAREEFQTVLKLLPPNAPEVEKVELELQNLVPEEAALSGERQ